MPPSVETERLSSVRAFVRALPALLVVAGVLYDHLTPRAFTAVPFFAAAPLVAAPLFSLSGTVATAAFAFVAVSVIYVRYDRDADAVTEVVRVVTVAVPRHGGRGATRTRGLPRPSSRNSRTATVSYGSSTAATPSPLLLYGATLLLHTDGLSEARDERGVFFDPAERLSGRTLSGPRTLLAALVDEVRRHTGGGTTDDMALLAVRRP